MLPGDKTFSCDTKVGRKLFHYNHCLRENEKTSQDTKSHVCYLFMCDILVCQIEWNSGTFIHPRILHSMFDMQAL